LILDGHVSGLFSENETLRHIKLAPKGKGILMGVAWNDEGMEGGNRSNAGSFWHQVRKKPELWMNKSKIYIV
jgi:hypothetical protein